MRLLAIKQETTLPDPKLVQLLVANKDPCQFIIVNNNLLQLQRFTTGTNSMIVNNLISKEGGLYTTSKYDPLYLLLFVMKSGCSDSFRPLYDIVFEADQPDLIQMIESLQLEEQLKHIADVQKVDDTCYFKYNEQSTLNWLDKKFNNLIKVIPSIKCLEQNLVRLTVEEIALRLLLENLPNDLQETLKLKYNLQPKQLEMNHFEVKVEEKKRTLPLKGKNSKKSKQLPAQKGKITDFFKPKSK